MSPPRTSALIRGLLLEKLLPGHLLGRRPTREPSHAGSAGRLRGHGGPRRARTRRICLLSKMYTIALADTRVARSGPAARSQDPSVAPPEAPLPRRPR